MTQRDIRDYLEDILKAMDLAQAFVATMTFDEFQADAKTTFAVIRALEIIGEATKNIPNSIRVQYPEIPWKSVAGMRDTLIHAYFGVNLEVVWDTVQQDLVNLRPVIEKILLENAQA
jgi:uncharacterized protein with HEPN domain